MAKLFGAVLIYSFVFLFINRSSAKERKLEYVPTLFFYLILH